MVPLVLSRSFVQIEFDNGVRSEFTHELRIRRSIQPNEA